MPKRQSDKARKRQQRQELLAQQDPEPKFDLSECELQEVPSTVFSLCKILQKEALFLHCNSLTAINGNITDWTTLRVLDLHNNELSALPDKITCLQRLQILNVEKNKLKKLPDSLGQLHSLQTLNVKNNKLKDLPDSVCDLPNLRLLDICQNDIKSLPRRLAYVRTLETLQLDGSNFKYPPKKTCVEGTEAIMRFLCSENGMEYESPSKFLLAVLDPPQCTGTSESDGSLKTSFQEEARLVDSVQQYQQLRDKKRAEARSLEHQLAEERRLQEQLATTSLSNKKHLMDAISQDQARMAQQLSELSSQKDKERKRFLQSLHSVEKSAGDLLTQLLDDSEKAKKTEALLDQLDRERMAEDNWFSVRSEELANLRKREVLEGMNYMLEEFRRFEEQRQMSQTERDFRGQQALQLEEEISSSQVQSLLDHRKTESRVLMDTLIQQETLQKQAVEALMMAQDSKHLRLSQQIGLIESELAQLSQVEVGKRSLKLETETNVIAEKRIALSSMLSQLLEEQMFRQKELHKRLGEMEQQREEGQTDYWLVQYQRLMDRKPDTLMHRESQMEMDVRKLLIQAGAEDYIPVFLRHRITTETMMQLSDADLKQMGVHEMGLRKAILKGIELKSLETDNLAHKTKDFSLLPQFDKTKPQTPSVGASAPPLGARAPGSQDSVLQASVVARGINSECVVCLDRTSEVIFLPCGHVCTCTVCSPPLSECPMCRAPVAQRVRLSVPVNV